MKKMIIAALASLMLAGVLAGASESALVAAPSTVLVLGDNASPTLADSPFVTSYGDSQSR